MEKLLLLAMMLGLLVNGCALSLSPEFSIKVKEDLGVQPVIYCRADLVQGVYGYPSFVESMSSNIQIIRGALVVDNEKVSLVRFDKQIKKYDFIFELKYSDITDVRVFKLGQGRRLVLKKGNEIYTLEIIKEGLVDRAQTYKFAIFIADKSGKSSSDFSKELERINE